MHFEIPADNIERAKSFYSKLFGWEIKEIPGMDYWMITTSGEKPVGGGMMKRQNPGQPIVNYIDVPSAKAVLSRPHSSCSGEAQLFERATARSHPMTSFRRLSLDIWERNSRPMDQLAVISSLSPQYPTASPAK
jgi:hypothetical protein